MHHHIQGAGGLRRGTPFLCSAWYSKACPLHARVCMLLSYTPAILLSNKVCSAGLLGTVRRGVQNQGTE